MNEAFLHTFLQSFKSCQKLVLFCLEELAEQSKVLTISQTSLHENNLYSYYILSSSF